MTDDETTRWIEIPGWDEFQHYSDRDPIWIKNYTRLMGDDDYLSLTGHTRAILHGLWLEYASTRRQLRLDTVSLSRRLSLRVTMQHLESLNHAGFIRFSASRPLALGYQDASLEKRREDLPLYPHSVGTQNHEPKPGTRASGTNPRALAEKAHGDHHLELVGAASRIAAHWAGGGSDDFDQRLDQLEAQFHDRLAALERETLWEVAFRK